MGNFPHNNTGEDYCRQAARTQRVKPPLDRVGKILHTGEMSLRESLINTADAYCAVTGVAVSRVGCEIARDGKFIMRLKEGGDCTTRTYENAMTWFSRSWPSKSSMPTELRQYMRMRGIRKK